MDGGDKKEILDMYKLVKQKEDEANARKAELRAQIGEDKANDIDAQSKRILAEIKAKEAAKAAKQQAKEEAKITKKEKKDNQVNSCRLF